MPGMSFSLAKMSSSLSSSAGEQIGIQIGPKWSTESFLHSIMQDA